MKYLLPILFLLAGCSTTVPVTQKFPQAPQVLQQPCKPLKEVQKDSNLVELTKVVVENYTEYYMCAETVQGWLDWYTTQKRIFEELK